MRPLHRNSSGQNQDKETATLIQTCQGEGTHLVVSTLILIRSLGLFDWWPPQGRKWIYGISPYAPRMTSVVDTNGSHPLRP